MSTFQPRRDKLVRTEGLTCALALGASPHAYGVPVGLLASRTLTSQSPTGSSGRRVYCSAMSARKWSIHRDVRPARCLTMAVRRFLRVGCMKWSKRKDWLARFALGPAGSACGGPVALLRSRTFAAARAARLQRAAIAVVRLAAQRAPARLTHPLRLGLRHLRASRSVCHASESGGSSGIDSRSRARGFAPRLRRAGRPAGLPHPRPSPNEGAALTAAPSSHGGPPRRSEAERPTSRLGARPRAPRASQMLRVLPVKSRRLHC